MSQRTRNRSKETKERGYKALVAMKEFGFPVDQSKTALKRLLKEYDNKWEHIEADNYSVLVDALIKQDEPDESLERKKKKPDNNELDDNRMDGGTELLRKRPRQNDQRPSIPVCDSGIHGQCSSQNFVLNDLPSPEIPLDARHELVSKEKEAVDQTNTSSLIHYLKKSKRLSVPAEPQALIPYKESKIEPGIESSTRSALVSYSPANDRPPYNGCPVIDEPIAVISHAPISVVTIKDVVMQIY